MQRRQRCNYSEISEQRLISVGEASRIRADMLHQTLTLIKTLYLHTPLITTYKEGWKKRKTLVKCLYNIQKYLGNHFIGLDTVYFVVKNAQ